MFNKIENKWFLDRHVASSICYFLSPNTVVTFQPKTKRNVRRIKEWINVTIFLHDKYHYN